jgi:anti-sigma regulatory factor (Ser/Thr protein kinase)
VQAVDHLHGEPVPRLVGEARRFIASRAPEISAELRDVLLLLTSELVTNAVIHARTAIEVGITVTDGSIVVTVHDEDLGRSEIPGPTPRDGGWGLGLVGELSAAHDMERHPGEGKTAWFRLARDDRGDR